jgi:hypothetical protein
MASRLSMKVKLYSEGSEWKVGNVADTGDIILYIEVVKGEISVVDPELIITKKEKMPYIDNKKIKRSYWKKTYHNIIEHSEFRSLMNHEDFFAIVRNYIRYFIEIKSFDVARTLLKRLPAETRINILKTLSLSDVKKYVARHEKNKTKRSNNNYGNLTNDVKLLLKAKDI